MIRLLVATRNAGKLRELRTLLAREPIELEGLDSVPELGEIEETGTSFVANARLKATYAARQLGRWVLGEDSGLEVVALGGAPGVHSARYAGAHGDDAANGARLIRELAGHQDRRACYICVMALADASGEIQSLSYGACRGEIRETPRGRGGFGYDPYFVPEGYECTMAELEPDEKARVSHRGGALRTLLPLLRVQLGAAGTLLG